MTVIDKRTEGIINFIDVEYGMPFEYDHSLYIKTNEGYATDDNFTNAVKLKTGMICKFGDMEKVRLVNASIVVGESEEE